MPYIKKEDRNGYEDSLSNLIYALEFNGWKVGDVTYVVYKIIARWFIALPKYSTIAAIRGMLAGCLSEFDRRFAFPYEDKKIQENGDVDIEDAQCKHLAYDCEVCNDVSAY